MIRLGLRLATSGGRGAVAGLAVSAAAVAIGTAVLLYALSFAPAVADRDARTAWRDTYMPTSDLVDATLVLVVEDRVDDRLLTCVLVAPAGAIASAPVPPGIPSLPEPGQAFVSPALAALITVLPADQLAQRIGSVVGVLPDTVVASPDELVAIIGVEPQVMRDRDAIPVTGFASTAGDIDLPPLGLLILVLAAIGALAPVAVFVSTATRLSAARRDLRLAALRLVGATPAQVAQLAMVEALVVTVIGSLGGIVLFFVARPLVALIPLDGTTWFPDMIAPPPLAAAAMLLAVQLVGAAGALVTMRGLVITPLGVQRRAAPPRPGASRLVPLAAALVALLVAVALYRNRDLPDLLKLGLIGGSFAAVIGSIALVGPLLTAAAGSFLLRITGGASGLMAARRLIDEPRGSFGAIAGVVMAVFVASAFFTFTAFTRSQAGSDIDPLLQQNGVVGFVRGSSGLPNELPAALSRLEGVTGHVAIRKVGVVDGEGVIEYGWVASCRDLTRILALGTATCSPSGVDMTFELGLAGPYRLVPDTTASGEVQFVDVVIDRRADEPLFAVDDRIVGFFPGLLVDPGALVHPADAERLPIDLIYVTTDGAPGVGERIRTAIIAAAPDAIVRLEAERVAQNTQFEEIGRIVGLGLIGTLGLAGCSLAIAVTTATLDRRRQFVFLRSAGMPVGALRSMILLQAFVPLAAIALASASLGALVGAAVLWFTSGAVALPDATLIGVIVASVAVSMGVVALTLPPLERMTRPASLRNE